MTNLVNYFLHPMTWLVIGCFILWRLWPRLNKMKKRIWVFMLFIVTYLTTTPFLPTKLNAYLEDQYPVLTLKNLDTSLTYHIIVLGGGMGYDNRLPANSLLEPVMLVRLAEGIRIENALPNCLLITSGYSSIGLKPQALVAREAAILLGVDSNSIIPLPQPSTTEQEAAAYAARFGKRTPLIIATSATHMPRAIYLFGKQGIKTVIPAPTHYMVKRQNPVSFKQFLQPSFQYWGQIQSALHEIFGMAYARFAR